MRASVLRATLLDDDDRSDLFPSHRPALLSKPSAKAIRLGFGDSVARISLTEKRDDRVAVSVQHSKLADSEAIDAWKFYWEEWLQAIDETT